VTQLRMLRHGLELCRVIPALAVVVVVTAVTG
jgi:hypothetical protein